MMRYGFSQKHLDVGWDGLRDVTRVRLGKQKTIRDPQAIVVLDKFENVWFVVSKATLQHRYPQVHDALFRNLKQSGGDSVALTVMTFLLRLREMEAGEGEYGEDGPRARDELRARGLTDEIVAEAQSHVESLTEWTEPDEEETDTSKEQEESEERMWAWYLEWSSIARVALTDRRLLRSLGYLSTKKGSRGGDDLDEDSAEQTEVIVTAETVAGPDVATPPALLSKPAAPANVNENEDEDEGESTAAE